MRAYLKKFVLKKHRQTIFLFLLLALGFLVRVFFVPYWVKINGDMLLFADWGEKFWEYGSQGFYFYKQWYYAPPNYPPLISLIYAGAFWLFEHKYVLAQIHNTIKVIPAAFIIYFYEHGYILLLKLPAILADLGLSFVIYKLLSKFTKDRKKAMIGMCFYLFNPVTIFLSGVWGQTDSLIAFFALLSFILLVAKKTTFSIPLYFISLYIKPNWVFFIPFYIFLLFIQRPKFREVLVGGLLTLFVFIVGTWPFAGNNVLGFGFWLLKNRILATAMVVDKVSISAFNFYTTLFTIDKSPGTLPILGIPAKILGLILFSFINLAVFSYVLKRKDRLLATLVGLFTIGLGNFLFLTGMLERYFFPAFVPMIVVMFTKPKAFIWGVLINIVVFANLVFSFFRRSTDEIANLFTNNNFLLIKALSAVNVASFLLFLKNLKPGRVKI